MYTQTTMSGVSPEMLSQSVHTSSSENGNSSPENITPPPPPSPLQAFHQNEKYEVKANSNKNTQKYSRSNSINTPSDSLEDEDEEEDFRSVSASSKDSGCEKSYVKRYSPKGNKSGGKNSKKTLPSSEVDLDSSSLFWGASLLYYTGLPSPRVKEHHFASSSSLSPSPISSKRNFFPRRKLRSTLSLGSDDIMDRPRSPFKRFSFHRKSLSKDSGNESSIITDASTGSSRDLPQTKEQNHSLSMSPLRKRHLNCVSPTEKGNMMDNLKDKIKGNASSLRLLKVTRHGMPSFSERTQSLPRSTNKISEEETPVAASCSTAAVNDEITERNTRDVPASPVNSFASTSASTSSASGFKSAKKAIRNSFKAARNFLPSSSKINSNEKTTPNDKKTNGKKDAENKGGQNTNHFDEPTYSNSSAPNTPVVIKKSRLERAKKKFASTLSLNTGSSSCGGGGGRSKSASTLVISDSELNPSVHCRTPVDHYCKARVSSKSADNLYEERAVDVLSVIEHPSASPANDVSVSAISKSRKDVNIKSPFRFIGRSKNKTDSKSESSTGKAEFQSGNEIKDESTEESKTKEALQSHTVDVKLEFVMAEGSKEKPNKKRTSIMKSIGKAITRSGKGNKEANKEQTVRDSKSRASEQDLALEKSGAKSSQEILTFENEPRVRTPKAPRRQRLNSGSGSASTASSSVGFTPPNNTKDCLNNSGDSSSTQVEDKDREIHGLEVSETSIDISPQKVFHPKKKPSVTSSLFVWKSHHEDGNNDNACRMRDVDHKDYDHSNKVIPGIGALHAGESSKIASSPALSINSFARNKSESKAEEKKGKTKSQSLITSLVTSSSGKKSSENCIMDDGKRKKKNGKKVFKKKLMTNEAQENTGNKNDGRVAAAEAPSNNNITASLDNEGTHSGTAAAAVGSESVQNRKDNNVEASLSSSSSRSNTRKSSDDDKDLRGNAVTVESSRATFAGRAESGNEIRGGSILDTKLDFVEDEVSFSSILKRCSGDYGGGNSNSGSKCTLNDIVNAARDQNANCSYAGSQNKIGTAIDSNIASALPDGNNVDGDGESNDFVATDDTDDPETACSESFRQLKPFNFNLAPVEQGKKERLYKVLVVGELGTGKTSIIKRYVHQFFSQHYRATIGVDFALKVLRWDPDTVVRLQLWDIAGQERFGSMTRVYYKEAVGAFVVFDVTRSATLEAVPKWKADLDNKVVLPDGRPIPTVLLANKSDQPKEGIAANREKMNDFCQQQGFSAWFETSAKDNINIDESANFLVSKILEMDKWSQEPLAPDPDKLDLTANGKHKGSSASNCAC